MCHACGVEYDSVPPPTSHPPAPTPGTHGDSVVYGVGNTTQLPGAAIPKHPLRTRYDIRNASAVDDFRLKVHISSARVNKRVPSHRTAPRCPSTAARCYPICLTTDRWAEITQFAAESGLKLTYGVWCATAEHNALADHRKYQLSDHLNECSRVRYLVLFPETWNV